MSVDFSEIVKEVCNALLCDNSERAKEIAQTHYPFKPTTYKEISAPLLSVRYQRAKEVVKITTTPKPVIVNKEKRKWNALSYTKLFIRDGFVDRYGGQRLVHPATIKLLSTIMPNEFPEDFNWALSRGHIMYWELLPTLDHIQPIAKGGKDEESNWVSTNWLHNRIKSNFTLDEIGWSLRAKGKFEDWDGLLHWFMSYIKLKPEYLAIKILKVWHNAASRCLAELPNQR